jgi:hypothetical protein
MFAWPWKKKADPTPEAVDQVWLDLAARDRAVVRAAQAGPVLVLASFDETLERLRAALRAASLDEGPTLVLARADQLDRVPAGAAVILAERHPLPAFHRALLQKLATLAPTVTPRCFAALDDALMLRFGGENLAKLMSQLGMAADEPIEHGLISRSLANAAKKMEQRLGPAVSRLAPAASMAEWFQKNLPPGD